MATPERVKPTRPKEFPRVHPTTPLTGAADRFNAHSEWIEWLILQVETLWNIVIALVVAVMVLVVTLCVVILT